MTDWRPGTARADAPSMLRVDQAGEYGATRIYAGQLAVLGDNHPASGAIGVWHAGIELKLLPGATACTASLSGSAADMLKDVFSRPLVRCDDVQWSWLGISMAGWNAIISILSAFTILWLSLTKTRKA